MRPANRRSRPVHPRDSDRRGPAGAERPRSRSNWEAWSGNCYGWTTWDSDHVTGHTWDHAYDDCRISIIQWNAYEAPGSGSSYRYADAYAPNTGASTPTWWHGPTDTGGLLEVQVCVQDMSTAAQTQCSNVYD